MLNIAAGAPASTGYNLTRSLRTRASASAYLSRTPASSSGVTTWTFSRWGKVCSISTGVCLLSVGIDANNYTSLDIDTNGKLSLNIYAGGILQAQLTTTQVFRDPSAWGHIVVVYDVTQATASNRIQFWYNGTRITAFDTASYPVLNVNWSTINTNNLHRIGSFFANVFSPAFYDNLQTETIMVSGQALTPSSFGSTNALTGVWQPARYTGTYGTNGFYLPFTDNSALTTSSNVGLGKDFSGNGNYWTTNNISITAGVTYDSMTDVPTLTNATTANFAVLNPLDSAASVLTNGNLQFTGTGNAMSRASIAMPSGKWYAEVTFNSGSQSNIGIATSTANLASYLGSDANGWGYAASGVKINNNTTAAYGASYTVNDVIGITFDTSNGQLTFYKNNVSQGVAYTVATTATYFFALGTGSCGNAANFGQRPFAYTPPTGFVALNAFNLPTASILKGNTVMNAATYTGDGNLTRTLTGLYDFQPDLIWPKNRGGAFAHVLQDSVRGFSSTRKLSSNTSDAENSSGNATDPGFGYISAVSSTGFSVATTGGGITQLNQGTAGYVAWAWKAGGAASSNTNGSITTQVSANTSSGFSVITYTGNGTSGATVGHGLGVAPKFWVIKRRDGSGAWKALSTVTGSVLMGELNTQVTWASPGAPMTTAPTSTVITLDASGDRNGTGQTYVIYAFAEIAGFSKITYFDGNGSTDGPFVYTGFRPKFTLSKDIEGGSNWAVMDSTRSPFNVASALLNADLADAESTSAIYDYLSNGIKLRSATNNQNNHKHIMISFAENPFKNSLAR